MDSIFLQGCRLAFNEQAAIIYAPDDLVALVLRRAKGTLANWALAFKKSCVQIFSPDYPDPFHISASMISENSESSESTQLESNEIPTIEIPELELDLNEAYRSCNPIYVTSLLDRTVLWCNLAALQAQQKSYRQFQGENAAALNEPEELERRCERLSNAENLIEYTYRAYRWFRNPETGIYCRKQMNFVSNFCGIPNFFGEPCYSSTVLVAEPTGVIYR